MANDKKGFHFRDYYYNIPWVKSMMIWENTWYAGIYKKVRNRCPGGATV